MRLKYKFVYKREEYPYEYDVDVDSDILIDEFSKEFGINKIASKNIIKEFALWECLEESYEEQITEYYEEEAREQFEEDMDYNSDPEGYYGVSRRYY